MQNMLVLAVTLAAVAVCHGGGFSQQSDPWASPFSFPSDPWNSVTADSAERANRLEGWQKEKLDEYQDRLEEQEQSEGLYAAPGLEDVWLNQQDVGLPLGLREQSFWKIRDADLESSGQFHRSDAPTRDVIITPEQQLEGGFREYAVNRPELVAAGVSRRPRLPLFAGAGTRDVIITPEQQLEGGFREYAVNRPEVVAAGVSRRPRLPFLPETDSRDVIITPEQQVEGGFREYAVNRPEVVAAGVSRRPRGPPFAAEVESPFRKLLLSGAGSRGSSRRSPLRAPVVYGDRPFREEAAPSVVYGHKPFADEAGPSVVYGPEPFPDQVVGSATYSPATLRGPLSPTGSLLDAVPPMVFNRPASVRAPASFRDVVVPAAPFSRRVSEEAIVKTQPRSSPSAFLQLLDPKFRLTSLASGYYDNKRQYLFDLMTEVVKFCQCRKTLASMKYWWGGFQGSPEMAQDQEEGRSKLLDDLGFRGQVDFDNFREIIAGTMPPPRNLQDFKDQFLRGMLDSVCRSARSYVSDVQNFIDVSLSFAPVV